VVEGAPLLRAYMGKTRIEGSNPSLSARIRKGLCIRPFFMCQCQYYRQEVGPLSTFFAVAACAGAFASNQELS
jgi:hypothetical protein